MAEPVGKEGEKAGPKALGVGIFGLGTVGSAVYQILLANAGQHARQAGLTLAVRRVVVRHLEKPRPVPVAPGLLTADPESILSDPDIGVVVEVMGGIHPAKEYVETALLRGKSVVTANKELISRYGQELLAIAQASGTDLFFEASVGGGIPIIRPLMENLAPGRLYRVQGIVNGTTNYILSQMAREGQSYHEALAQAQAAGYAEADPRADVEGHDAARKLAILAGIAFHTHVPPEQVAATGITGITPTEIGWAARQGRVLKLIAHAERLGSGEILARVEPAFLSPGHPLAQVHGPMNAILVQGEEIGETLFYGPGAGGLPTATAVISDLLEAARHRRLGVATSHPWAVEPARLATEPAPTRYYLRLQVTGEPLAGSLPPEPMAAVPAGRTPAAPTSPPPAAQDPTAQLAAVAAVQGPAAGPPAVVSLIHQQGIPVQSWERLADGEFILLIGPVRRQEIVAAVAKPKCAVRLAQLIPVLD